MKLQRINLKEEKELNWLGVIFGHKKRETAP